MRYTRIQASDVRPRLTRHAGGVHHVLLCLLAVPHTVQPVSCTHSRARSCQVSVNVAGGGTGEAAAHSTFATGRRAPGCALACFCFVEVWFPNPWAARGPRGCGLGGAGARHPTCSPPTALLGRAVH